MMKNESALIGLAWKLAERFGTQGVQFVLQMLLARILDPTHYGTLSLMVIFLNLANSFIHHGINMALVQRTDIKEDDYSYVFWGLMGGTSLIYLAFFGAAPWIESFFHTTEFVQPFRVLMLMLIPGVMTSVNVARFSRALDFKKIFWGNIGGIVLSGIVGLVLAVNGAGLWALVVQTLLKEIISCVIIWFQSRWMPRWCMNVQRVRILFGYGWKLMVSSLLNTLYNDLRSIVIGVKYNSAALSYYNRGKQFPDFVIHSVNGAVQSVMLPTLSVYQENKEELRKIMRISISLSAYVIFPVMGGLAAVAEPLVRVLLTDKWLPCVPFLQVYCFTLAFHPVHSCNLQAINAIGRSDIYLKIEVIKKIYGLLLLAMAVFFFDSPLVIALTGAFSTIISCFVNASPNKKLVGYSFLEQVVDIMPAFFMSSIMVIIVMCVGLIEMPTIAQLLIQIFVGIIVYAVLSFVCKPKAYRILMQKVLKRR